MGHGQVGYVPCGQKTKLFYDKLVVDVVKYAEDQTKKVGLPNKKLKW